MISALRTFLVASAILLCTSGMRATEDDTASEADIMGWRSFQIVCFENQETGRVSLAAQAGDQGITAFIITAFGKQYSVPRSDLLRIKDYPLNSAHVSHEVGYVQLGGHTVSAKLRRDYYNKEKKLISEEAYVSVSKGKGLAVTTRTLQQ